MIPSQKNIERAERVLLNAQNDARRLATEQKRRKHEEIQKIKIKIKKEYLQLKKNMRQYKALDILATKYNYELEPMMRIIATTRIPKE